MPKSGPNKTALWRKTPKQFNPEMSRIERYGRRLRDAMHGINHPGYFLPIHLWLFRAAGISTPNL